MLVDLLGEINFPKGGQTKGLMKKNDGMISGVTGFPSQTASVFGVWKERKGSEGDGKLKREFSSSHYYYFIKVYLMKLYRNSC